MTQAGTDSATVKTSVMAFATVTVVVMVPVAAAKRTLVSVGMSVPVYDSVFVNASTADGQLMV